MSARQALYQLNYILINLFIEFCMCMWYEGVGTRADVHARVSVHMEAKNLH